MPSEVEEGRGLDVYAKAAIANGSSSIIRGSFARGLAGHGVIAARLWDSFGAEQGVEGCLVRRPQG